MRTCSTTNWSVEIAKGVHDDCVHVKERREKPPPSFPLLNSGKKKCVGEKKNNDGGEQKMKLFKVCLQPAKQVEPRGKPEVAMKEGTKISLEALAFLPEVAGYGTDVVGELAV